VVVCVIHGTEETGGYDFALGCYVPPFLYSVHSVFTRWLQPICEPSGWHHSCSVWIVGDFCTCPSTHLINAGRQGTGGVTEGKKARRAEMQVKYHELVSVCKARFCFIPQDHKKKEIGCSLKQPSLKQRTRCC